MFDSFEEISWHRVLAGTNVLHVTSSTSKRNIFSSTLRAPSTQFISRDVVCVKSTSCLFNHWGNISLVRFNSLSIWFDRLVVYSFWFVCKIVRLLVVWFGSYDLGSLAKALCKTIFTEQGCHLCLKLFDSATSRSEHKNTCCLSAPTPMVRWLVEHQVSSIELGNLSSSGSQNVLAF